ncbi:hypothetical protein [Planctomicrobium sp. SH664]|uniref:hypothetical protein n=1 Tax=Planctomicrobium sp. SH664 TaxID=3448125 RepID=UPI003F5AEB69
MKSFRIALLLLPFLTFPVTAAEQLDEKVEPPLAYTLTIGSQRVPLTPGHPVKVSGAFRDPQVTLNQGDVRKFPYGEIEFEYPARFSWTANLDTPGLKIWNLGGKETTILYFVANEELTPAGYVSELANRFGRPNCQIFPVVEKFDGQEVAGQKIVIKQEGATVVQYAYAIPHKGNQRRLFVVQEVLMEGKSPQAYLDLMEQLRKTLKFK